MPNCPPAEDIFSRGLPIPYIQTLSKGDLRNFYGIEPMPEIASGVYRPKLVFGKWGELAASNLYSSDYSPNEYYFSAASYFINKLDKEYSRFSTGILKGKIIQKGLEIINYFASNEISKIYSEFTDDNSILVSGTFEDKKIYVELFLSDEINDPQSIDETVINIYQNKDNVLCDAGTSMEVFFSLRSYLEKAEELGPVKTTDISETYIPNTFAANFELQTY